MNESVLSNNIDTTNNIEKSGFEDVLTRLFSRIKKVSARKIEPNKYQIYFPIFKYEGGVYEIFLVKENGKFFMSDDGATYQYLDKTFELNEPDVIKNIVATIKHFGCRKHPSSNAFTMECTPFNVHIQMSNFIQTLTMLLNMRIFYN